MQRFKSIFQPVVILFVMIALLAVSCSKQPIEGAWQVQSHNSPTPIELYQLEFFPNKSYTVYLIDGSSSTGDYQITTDSLFLEADNHFKVLNLTTTNLTLQQVPGVTVDTFVVSLKKL